MFNAHPTGTVFSRRESEEEEMVKRGFQEDQPDHSISRREEGNRHISLDQPDSNISNEKRGISISVLINQIATSATGKGASAYRS